MEVGQEVSPAGPVLTLVGTLALSLTWVPEALVRGFYFFQTFQLRLRKSGVKGAEGTLGLPLEADDSAD